MNHRPHRHLIVDAAIKNCPKDEAEMKAFLASLIVAIGMTVAVLSEGQSNPIAWYCDEEGNEGMTAGAILTTSHTVLHVWDSNGRSELHFDLYSCSDFDPMMIMDELHKQFVINGEANVTVIDRQRGKPTEEFKWSTLA